MMIERDSLTPIDFQGLEIRDYTAGGDHSSSLAEILVPAGARHATSWSKRSDKIYYVVAGRLGFIVGDEAFDLAAGDACVITRGSRFSYENASGRPATLILVHTPSFDLSQEVFE